MVWAARTPCLPRPYHAYISCSVSLRFCLDRIAVAFLKMNRLLTIGLSTLAALVVMAATSSHASAFTPHLPVSTALTTVPSSVSWPGSRDFEFRVEMTAGPVGAHFIFTVPAPSWGFSGVYGSPFSYGQPSLDGPGELKPSLSIVADPVPWACWRGAFAGGQNWYEVTLDPGTSTTVVVPSRLEGAPLEGMKTITDFRMENGDDPVLVDADVEVGGTPGILIKTRIAGHDTKLPASIAAGRPFVLRGLTRPALANRRINLRAMPHSAAAGGKPYRIATVKTDAKGHFKTKRLKIRFAPEPGGQAIWSFSSRLASPGRFANQSSCGPAMFLGSGS